MSGVLRLLVMQARRDRVQLLIWTVGIGLMVSSVGAAVAAEFADSAERRSLVAFLAGNPAIMFLRGVPTGSSIGELVFSQAFTVLAVLAGLMSTFLVVRHTRGDEDLGRAELVGATRVARTAELTATLILLVAANVLLVLASGIGLSSAGLEVGGSWLTALGIGAVGLVAGAIAAVVAQLMPSSSGANGLAAALVGIFYLVRGVGDALSTPAADFSSAESTWVSWLSPIGWAQRTAPFSSPDPAPLLLHLALASVASSLALALRSRRDLGASLVQERLGRARGSGIRRSAVGVTAVRQRPLLIGWCIGAALLGSFAGALSQSIADALESNAALAGLLGRLVPDSRADALDLFATAILGLTGVLAATAGVQSMTRARSEEAEGRVEMLLSTPLTRLGWIGGHLAVSAGCVVIVTLVAGLAAGFGFLAVGEPAERLPSSLVASLTHAPTALVFVGVTALILALAPRLTIPVGWAVVILAVIVGQFGELLNLPDWAQDLSPFHHTPALPSESFEAGPLVVLSLVAVAVGVAAVALLRRRDIPG